MLEALACREALALAQDLDLHRICVATDGLKVVNNLQQPYTGAYRVITREIKDTARYFEEVVFKHESKCSNGEVHRLARSCVNQDWETTMVVTAP
jgi:hypothetical protein